MVLLFEIYGTVAICLCLFTVRCFFPFAYNWHACNCNCNTQERVLLHVTHVAVAVALGFFVRRLHGTAVRDTVAAGCYAVMIC